MFDRITHNPKIFGGKPIIRGTRISVEIILEWIASGGTRDSIVAQYPDLTIEDVQQAIEYSVAAVKNEVLLTSAVQ